MSPSLKRKTSPAVERTDDEPVKRRFVEAAGASTQNESQPEASEEPKESSTTALPEAPAPEPSSNDAAAKARERQERFKALQARQAASRKQNLKESAAETQRLATDPNLLASLHRKRAVASHKLLQADTAAAGEDFERKRAWDWTVEESEKWDRRMEKKGKHREDVAFQDYRQEAKKVYKRQLRDFKPDMEAYEKEKAEAIERAAQSGGLEIVEMEDGELVAVDKEGTFYSTKDSTDFVQNRPDRAAVDR